MPLAKMKAAKAAKVMQPSTPTKKPPQQTRILEGQTNIRIGSAAPSSTSTPQPSRPPSEASSSPRPLLAAVPGIIQDISDLSLTESSARNAQFNEEPDVTTYSQTKLIEEARQAMNSGKIAASVVVIGMKMPVEYFSLVMNPVFNAL